MKTGNFFLIALFSDHCLLVPFCSTSGSVNPVIKTYCNTDHLEKNSKQDDYLCKTLNLLESYLFERAFLFSTDL